MKKLGKKLLTLLVAGAMLTGLMTPALAAEGDATQVTNDKGRVLYFKDIGADYLMTDDVAFYKKAIQSNGFFKDWVSIAYNVFESQSDSYWDHAGDGWDGSYGKNGTYIDFVDYMLNAKDRTIEEAGVAKENVAGYVSTGLSVANSLAEVQARAADDIASLPNRKLTGADFLKRHKMESLTDTGQLVLYSTVTTFDRYGRTEQIGYDSFTIAFYDFQLHVLSNEDVLDAKTTADTSAVEDGFVALATNEGKGDMQQSVTLANTVSESLSATLSNSETYTFGESIGMTYSYGAKIPVPELPGAEVTSGFSITGNLSYSQAMQTAYSKTESETYSTNKSSTATYTVPAHTKLMAQQTSAQTRVTQTYDCPVGITYKVAIFSMCGTCYDDNAATQSFSTAGYEQRSFVTHFGASTDAADAVESLFQRATNHKDDTSYDETYGCTKGTDDDGDVWCTGLNWKNIIDQGVPSSKVSGLKGGTTLTYALDDTYPMSSAGGVTSIVQDSVTTTLGTAQPILPIASTYIPWQVDNDWSLDRAFELTVGETVPISSYRVKACDKDAVDYYGFVATKGTWKIVDANGKETTSDVARMVYDSVTGSQILEATGEGRIYVKYFIPENTYYTYDGVASTNANISSPAYGVVVSAEEAEPFTGTIELTGSVAATVGEELNLNAVDTLTVAAYDATDKKVKVDLFWEARELEEDGITVTPDGVLTTTQPGTFHVRAYIDDVYSDWVEVVVTEPQELLQYICYHPFTDVVHASWYEEAVEFVYQNDIMDGVKDTLFQPGKEVTRAQVAQTLYNLAGAPFIVDENPFADVADDAWYADAVTWAAANGLTTGVKADKFAPNEPVTREQLVTFVCRYADWADLALPSGTADLSQYQDADQISTWAKDFIVRALEAGIIQGKSTDTLAPQGTANRAEIAQIFMNLLAE